MNKELIEEKLLTEKNARLIDIFEINSRYYAKTITVTSQNSFKIQYKYYDVTDENVKELDSIQEEEISQFFTKDYGNTVY